MGNHVVITATLQSDSLAPYNSNVGYICLNSQFKQGEQIFGPFWENRFFLCRHQY